VNLFDTYSIQVKYILSNASIASSAIEMSALLPSGPDALFIPIACEKLQGLPCFPPWTDTSDEMEPPWDPREDEHVARAGGGSEVLPQTPRHLVWGWHITVKLATEPRPCCGMDTMPEPNVKRKEALLEWRARQESNLRPSPSEGDALSS
jgi:hypothetical protein